MNRRQGSFFAVILIHRLPEEVELLGMVELCKVSCHKLRVGQRLRKPFLKRQKIGGKKLRKWLERKKVALIREVSSF